MFYVMQNGWVLNTDFVVAVLDNEIQLTTDFFRTTPEEIKTLKDALVESSEGPYDFSNGKRGRVVPKVESLGVDLGYAPPELVAEGYRSLYTEAATPRHRSEFAINVEKSFDEVNEKLLRILSHLEPAEQPQMRSVPEQVGDVFYGPTGPTAALPSDVPAKTSTTPLDEAHGYSADTMPDSVYNDLVKKEYTAILQKTQPPIPLKRVFCTCIRCPDDPCLCPRDNF